MVGETTGNKRFTFVQPDGICPIDMDLDDFLGKVPVTVMEDTTIEEKYAAFEYDLDKLDTYLENVLRLEAVACKDWLTNKVDRSVTGKVARQQCQGKIQLPLNDLGAVALDYKGKEGIATSIGPVSYTHLDVYKRQDPMLQEMYEKLDQGIFTIDKVPDPIIYIDDIAAYNEKEGLALSEEEIAYLNELSKKMNRKLTDSEVFGFSQVNSEHCRHKIFNGKFIIDGEEKESTLFQLIKKTSQVNPNKLVSAYKDNVAFVEGRCV